MGGVDGWRAQRHHIAEAVQGGESRALVVRGDPGVGKTALLERLAPGVRVSVPRGTRHRVQSAMELAYAGLHRLMRSCYSAERLRTAGDVRP